MHESIKKILELLKEGVIPPDEGELLCRELTHYLKTKLPAGKSETISDHDECSANVDEILGCCEDEDSCGVSLEKIKDIAITLPDEIDFRIREIEDRSAILCFKSKTKGAFHFNREKDKMEISIMDKLRHETLEVEIHTPSSINFDIKGKHGDVYCRGISGNLNIEGLSFDIELENYSGKNAYLITKDGDVEVKNSEGAIHIRSTGGDALIEEMDGKADVSIISGNIELKDMVGEINVFSQSGNIEAENLEGKISLRSLSGDIEICNASGETHLNTGSGDIEITESLGVFKVSTESGDVESNTVAVEELKIESCSGNIEMDIETIEEGAGIFVNSQSGSIILALPDECDGSIEAHTTSGCIENRFPVFKTESGGEHLFKAVLSDSKTIDHPGIKLETESGDIIIKNR